MFLLVFVSLTFVTKSNKRLRGEKLQLLISCDFNMYSPRFSPLKPPSVSKGILGFCFLFFVLMLYIKSYFWGFWLLRLEVFICIVFAINTRNFCFFYYSCKFSPLNVSQHFHQISCTPKIKSSFIFQFYNFKRFLYYFSNIFHNLYIIF